MNTFSLLSLTDSTQTYTAILEPTLLGVNERLSLWFTQSDYLTQMAIPFSATAGSSPWESKALGLQEQVLTGQYAISVEVRSGVELAGALGAYSAIGTTGQATIYLNGDWLNTASSEQVQAVILEELGHSFDNVLNNGTDSKGDEGAIFAALAQNQSLDSQTLQSLKAEQDQGVLLLDNQSVAVEFSVAPVNVNYGSLNFDRPTDKVGRGTRTGDIRLYSNVFAGVDAILTVVNTNGLTITDLDATSAGSSLTGNQSRFLTPQLSGNRNLNGKAVELRIDFIAAGSYNNSTRTGTPVTLEQVVINTYDIDIKQFQSVTGVDSLLYSGAELRNVFDPATKKNTFQSTTSQNYTGDVTRGNNQRIKIYFNEISSFTTQLGSNGFDTTGAAYFFLDFSQGPGVWDSPSYNLSNVDGSTINLDTKNFFTSGTGAITATGLPPGLTIVNGVITGRLDANASVGTNQTDGLQNYVVKLSRPGTSTQKTINWVIYNVAPQATNDTAITQEEKAVSGNVLTNDTDGSPDSDALTVTRFTVNGTTFTAGQTATLTGVGTLIINANGSYTFTPAPHYAGPVPVATYTVTDNQGGTATATLTITIENVNDPPVLDLDKNDSSGATGSGYRTTFREGTPVAIADIDVGITDLDSPQIVGATINLTNHPDGNLESLRVNGALPPGITASSYNPATGVLTLTGSATLAQYQTAIAQIQYNNSSPSPNTNSRQVTVVVTDGQNNSNTATTTITVVSVNTPPTLDLDLNNSSGATGNDYKTTFVEGTPVAIGDRDVQITDVDSPNMTGATLTLVNRLDGNGIESLVVNGVLPGGIHANAYNPNTGVLTLTGTATLADYQAAIAQIQYKNTSSNPNTTDRQVTAVVTDGTNSSNTATATIAIRQVNSPPILDLDANNSSGAVGANYQTRFTPGTAVAIGDVDVSITDPDSTTITGATITLTNRPDGNTLENLRVNGPLPAGITASNYNASTGVLTLRGSATLAQYQAAIAQIQYNNTAAIPNTTARQVTVTVTDGTSNSNTATTTIEISNNTPPVAVDDRLTTTEDRPLVILPSDLFGGDGTGNNNDRDPLSPQFQSITVTELPPLVPGSTTTRTSTLFLNGVPVTQNQVISVADILAGKLTIVPLTDFTGDTNFKYTVSNGRLSSNEATVTVNITPVNDAPSVSLRDGIRTFTEGGSAIFLGLNTVVSDPELGKFDNWDGASITLQRQGGANPEDVFDGRAIFPQGLIEGQPLIAQLKSQILNLGTVTTNSNGTLTLTFAPGVKTADVNLVVQALTYRNTNPNPPSSVAIQYTVNDDNDETPSQPLYQGTGGVLTGTNTVTVVIIPTNNPPILDLDRNDSSGATGSKYRTTFVEGTPVAIGDVDVSVTDLDDTHLEGAVISLKNPLNGNLESLQVNGALPPGIVASAYDPVTHTLTLSGSATLAQYQTAIAQIQYNNTSNNPNLAAREVTVVVTDGTNNSNIATTTILTQPVNDPPVLDLDANNSSGATGADYKTAFTEGSPVLIGDQDVSITDGDDVNMERAVLTLTNRIDGNVESLSVNGLLPPGITASFYNPTTGVLTLTGSATLADYQKAIAQIQYNNLSQNPDLTPRTVTVLVNDGNLNSNTATTTITMNRVNDPPIIDLDANNSSGAQGADYKTTFTEGTPVAIADVDTSITDVDSPQMTGATITLTNSLDGATVESLRLRGPLPTGITASSYNPTTGVLTLTGSATQADYQRAISLIDYQNTSHNPNTTPRTVTVTVTDGSSNSNTAISTITVNRVNDPPVLDLDANNSSGVPGADYKTTFTEGTPVAIADVDTSINDLDSTNITGATLTLTNRPDGNNIESLLVNGKLPPGISSVAYDPKTGVISLKGNASLAAYQTAITQIQYNNTSQNPSTTPRIVTVYVTDGTNTSNTATTTIAINPVNDPPTLDLDNNNSSGSTGADYQTLFIKGSPVAIGDQDVKITDIDSTNITGATITLTTRPDKKVETLFAAGPLPAGITASSYNYTTGVLTLTGSATLADYQTAIAQIQYNNNASNPTLTPRLVTVVVTDGTSNSNTATTTISIVAVNDPPSGQNTTKTILEDSSYTFTVTDFGFSDSDNNTLAGVKITTLPSVGTLTLNGAAVQAGQVVNVGDFSHLLYTPVANANRVGSTPYSSFTFQVQDNGGTGNGGSNLDPTPNTFGLFVTPVNDAPLATANAVLAPVIENTANPPGAFISSLFANKFDDSADTVINGSRANTFAGLAITGSAANPTTEGRWQYLDGRAWADINLPGLSNTNALTLLPTTKIRFLPASGFYGTPGALRVRVIDNSGASGAIANAATKDVSSNGGTTAISLDTRLLETEIRHINLPPVIHELDGDFLNYPSGSGPTIIDQLTPTAQTFITDPEGIKTGGVLTIIPSAVLGLTQSGNTLGFKSGDGSPVTITDTDANGIQEVRLGGLEIGTIDPTKNGQNGTPLVITFNGNITNSLSSTLLQNITYQYNGPQTGIASLVFQVTDGQGGISNQPLVDINVNSTGATYSAIYPGGTDRADTIFGNQSVPTKEVIHGRGANDTLYGYGEDDILFGDKDNDRLFGGDGNDVLVGGQGIDDLKGENGNDTLLGGTENDVLSGGLGDDFLSGGVGADRLTGNQGADRFDYRNLPDSLLRRTSALLYDKITDFVAGTDLLVVATQPTVFNNFGAITRLDSTLIAAKLTATTFVADSAGLFTVGRQTFIAINDATAGYEFAKDAIIEVTGFTPVGGSFGVSSFMVM